MLAVAAATRNCRARFLLRRIAPSSNGQIISGLCVISMHLMAFKGTPGPAQGAE